MVSVGHVSNVLGTVNPVVELTDLASNHGTLILVDGVQPAPTRPVDVEVIDADFYALSDHRMLGPTGIGVLYGKRHLLAKMDLFLYGGEMIADVALKEATWNTLPMEVQGGRAGHRRGDRLGGRRGLPRRPWDGRRPRPRERARPVPLVRLEARDDVETYGPPLGEERAGLVAFNVDGVYAYDLSGILNGSGIAIRAGDHCTQPLHDELGISGSVRASVYVYNTRAEINRLLDPLGDGKSMLADCLRSDRFSRQVLAGDDMRRRGALQRLGRRRGHHLVDRL